MGSRMQITLVLDIASDASLEKVKAAVAGQMNKGKNVTLVSVAGQLVQKPGRPAEVLGEILDYLEGRKAKSARQISRGIQRTTRSVYQPLRLLEQDGLVEKVRNQKYNMNQWRLVKDSEEETGA